MDDCKTNSPFSCNSIVQHVIESLFIAKSWICRAITKAKKAALSVYVAENILVTWTVAGHAHMRQGLHRGHSSCECPNVHAHCTKTLALANVKHPPPY